MDISSLLSPSDEASPAGGAVVGGGGAGAAAAGAHGPPVSLPSPRSRPDSSDVLSAEWPRGAQAGGMDGSGSVAARFGPGPDTANRAPTRTTSATPTADESIPPPSTAHNRIPSATNTPPNGHRQRQQSARRSMSVDAMMIDAPSSAPPAAAAVASGAGGEPDSGSDHPPPHQQQQQPLPQPGLAASALSDDDAREIDKMTDVVARSPYQYATHLDLIALLRRIFLAQESEDVQRALLPLLRKARDDASKLFPLKETMWLEWIEDESGLARTLDERLNVIDVCTRAVDDQISGVKLWKAYGDYMEQQYLDGNSEGAEGMSPEQLNELKEAFPFELVLETFKQGAELTGKDIADSHLVWDKYRDLLMHDLEQEPTAAKIENIYAIYRSRLSVPHSNASETFSAFSSFVTTHDNANYEKTMLDYNKPYAASLEKYNERDMLEFRLQKERDAGEERRLEEWNAWKDYLEWETTRPRKKLDVDMACALYERCLLRFGEQATVWEDYVYFVLEKANDTARVITLLKRATRHCPWSGTLWAQYIIALERGGAPFEDVAAAKHLATRTELLDAGGLEELIKVNIAWCGFLQRRAFDEDATEDDLDMAEMGIAEAVMGTGKEDPHYRLQRIQINFYTLARKLASARKIWGEIKKTYSHSYEFWLRHYEWELANGSKEQAGNVIHQAVNTKGLDWPEKILETWKSHVEDCGNVEEVETMMVRYRKASKEVTQKRELEAQIQQAEYAAQLQASKADAEEDPEAATEDDEHASVPASSLKPGKRRRSAADPDTSQPNKKAKPENNVASKQAQSAASAPRDREHLTIIVKNLPPNCPDTKLRQFFRECGTINSIKTVTDADGSSSIASVEFDSKDDVLAALTRDLKTLDGRSLEVSEGTGATLYVTNFPPTADEAYIRDLFKDYGEIIEVRFPSLKYNTHRRFCYVQFAHPSFASAATALDGTKLGEKETLSVALSAPQPKDSRQRQGPLYEGREVYVRKIDYKAVEEDLRKLFEPFGEVMKVRLPPGKGNRPHMGYGFITFKTAEQAQAAVEGANGRELGGREIEAQIASADKRQKLGDKTVAPGPTSAASPASTADTGTPPPPPPDRETISRKTIGVLNLPDTINAARVQAIFSAYGALRKVELRPDHRGAIVEYESPADAGKASLAANGTEIDGQHIRIGTFKELMAMRPEIKVTRGFPKKKDAPKSSVSFAPRSVVAPRGGRGGGAGRGVKRGLGFAGAVSKRKEDEKPEVKREDGMQLDGVGAEPSNGTAEKKGLSNEDFKKKFFSSSSPP